MAIAFDAFSAQIQANTATVTGSHTTGTGSDRFMVVAFAYQNLNDLITGVTYNGVSMTRAQRLSPSTTGQSQFVYYLANPASGVNDVVISQSGSSFVTARVWTFTGVDQTYVPVTGTGNGESTAVTASLTTTADNCWLASVYQGSGTLTAGTNTFLRDGQTSAGAANFTDSNGPLTPAGSFSQNVTLGTSTVWGMIAIEIKPVASSGISVDVPVINNSITLPVPTVSFPTAGTITLTEPADGSVAQRNSSNQGSLTISGTYTETPTTIEYRIVEDGTSTEVKTWTLLDATPAGGTFSGTATGIAQGGWYNVQVRFSNDTGVTDNGTNKWGVGMIVAVYGQSNAEFWFWTIWGASLTKNDLVSYYNPTGWNVSNGSGIYGDNTIANGAISFGNSIATALNIPVALVDAGVASSSITALMTGTNLTNLTDLTTAIGGSVEYIIYAQGETDADANMTQATYFGHLGTLLTNLRSGISAVSGILPMVMSIVGRREVGITGDSYNDIRSAQIQKINEDSDVYKGGETVTYDLNDGIHYGTGSEGFEKHGKLIAQAVLKDLGEVTFSTGPQVLSFNEVSKTIYDVTISHSDGTDFTPTTGITGFRVFDDAVESTISSAVRVDETTIRLTLSVATSGTVTADYMSGITPIVTGAVKDNTSLLYPLQANLNIEEAITISAPTISTEITFPVPTVSFPINIEVPVISNEVTLPVPTVIGPSGLKDDTLFFGCNF